MPLQEYDGMCVHRLRYSTLDHSLACPHALFTIDIFKIDSRSSSRGCGYVGERGVHIRAGIRGESVEGLPRVIHMI